MLVWKRNLCAAAIAAVFSMSAQAADEDAVSVNAKLKDFASNLAQTKLTKPEALSTSEVHSLINAALGLLVQKEPTKPLEIQQAELSKTLLTAFPKPHTTWTKEFSNTVGAQATFFSGEFASYDNTLEFVRAAGLMSARMASVIQTNNQAIVAAAQLAPALSSRFPSPAASITLQAQTAATSLISLVSAKTNPNSRQVLLADKATVDKLDELRQELAAFSTRNEKRVHILGALYGDLNVIDAIVQKGKPIAGGHHRLCIATATVAESCERKAECKVTPAPADYRNGICGYDPAPFLDKAYKGLVVWYVCNSNTNEHNWNGVSGRLTGIFDPKVNKLGTAAVLYSASQSFSCKDLE